MDTVDRTSDPPLSIVSDHGERTHSDALSQNRKRSQGTPDARKRPANYTPVCEQAADTADGVSCDRLLSIVIPVYNEADNIKKVFHDIEAKLHMPYRIILVYDSELDTTLPVARAWQTEHPTVELLKNRYGHGALNAIKTGFEEVKEGAILVMMADLADDLAPVDEMFAKVKAGYDIVCGSRYMQGGKQLGGPLLKRTLSRWAGVSLHTLIGLPTHDATNSFKIYTKNVLSAFTIESSGGFELGIELVVKAFVHGYKITEVPSVWQDRVAGKSRFRLWRWLPHYLRWYWYGLKHGLCRCHSSTK